MSQQKQCPFCRRVIRLKDKFCPFCGRYVLDESTTQSTFSRGSPPPSPYPAQPPAPSYPPAQPPAPSYPPAPPPAPEPQEPEKLSEDVIEQIALRVELKILDNAMSEIRKRLEELAETISKTEVTGEVEQRIKNLKTQIKEIKEKREGLNLNKKSLPYEEELQEKAEVQDRLKNLNEAYRAKKVTESAFKKLRTEYEEKLQEIDSKSRAFKAKTNIWVKSIKQDKQHVQEEIEILEARHAAGEIPKDQYDEQKLAYDAKLKRYENVIEYLAGNL
jgi:DNA repair exonuclease SbcCD ATPase subunit